jgi:hypothetical protein
MLNDDACWPMMGEAPGAKKGTVAVGNPVGVAVESVVRVGGGVTVPVPECLPVSVAVDRMVWVEVPAEVPVGRGGGVNALVVLADDSAVRDDDVKEVSD